MQIDFHHAVTYVTSRIAGMSHDEAHTISYAAQYVDDATNHGLIKFDNGATYSREATAHKMLDYSNFQELANNHSWIPFHFLPGNDLKAANENTNRRFVHKLQCQPGSYVAHDMVKDCILEKHKPYGLHRLGITMHVFVDTWSHYGFCGVTHEVNKATKIQTIGTHTNGQPVDDTKITSRLKSLFGSLFDNAASDFVDGVQPLGHGSVLSYPDLPYLKWKYINGLGEEVLRDNPKNFLIAVKEMHQAISRYRLGDPDATVEPMNESDFEKIKELIHSITNDDGEKRHRIWLRQIEEGKFSFGPVSLEYIPKGEGSWKHKALETVKAKDAKNEVFKYKDSFLTSDWKMFHDAAVVHRNNILRNILPRYGICVG